MIFRKVCIALLLLVSSTLARAEYFTIRHYQVNVTFAEDGSALFDEIIDVEFSEARHGIFRFIPVRSEVNGKTVDRLIRDIQVDGYKFTTSKENHNLVIKIGDANILVDGRQTYHLRYRVLNPLNFFDDHTEFYWDLLGVSWPVVIETCDFDVAFPENVSLGAEDARVYTGASGMQGHVVEMDIADREIKGRTTQKLMPNEGLTLAVNLEKDAFKPMDSWKYFLTRHGLLLAPIFFLLSGIIGLFLARNKRQTIMTEYFPPTGISPAVAGGFVDNSIDNNDVLCLIPHLANKGYLRMEAEEGKGLFKKDNIIFFKLKEAAGDLMTFERQFFDALFSTGSEVDLKDLKDKFYMHMSAVKSSVKQWIKDQGWYEPDQRAMGCVTGIGGLGALGWGGFALFANQNTDGIALIVTGFILFFFASRFNKRTATGNETFRKLEGFRQFVAKAERPVIERLMKDDHLYYDKTMPYALAFGYLKKWNTLFDGLLSQPPSWYSSPGMYGTNLTRSWTSFSESFPTEINQIGSVFGSSPSSSGSGGGGGGFSGGGSGGGGGGSW